MKDGVMYVRLGGHFVGGELVNGIKTETQNLVDGSVENVISNTVSI